MMLSPREAPKFDAPGDLLGERRIQNRKSRGKFLLSATSYRGFQKAELCLLGEGEKIKIPGWELFPLVPWDEPREFGAHSLAVVSHFPGAGAMCWKGRLCAGREGPAVCRCRAGCARGRDAVSALRERSPRPEHLPGNYGTGPPFSHSRPWAPASLPSAWPLPKASLSSPLPRSAPLFKLWPSELPPHPRRWLRDGAAEERSCHVNFPLFFRAPRTDRLPSNFCGNYMRRSSLCKTYIFFFPACENSAERWGILTTPQPSIYRLVRHRLWASLKRKLAAFDPSGSWMRLLSQPLLRAQPSELLYLYLIKDSKPTSTMHKYWSAAWKLKSLHLSALRSLMELAWWCRIFLLSQQRGKSWLQEWFANTAPWKEKCRASSIVSEWNVTFSQKLSCLGWQRLGNCAFLERWLQWQR